MLVPQKKAQVSARVNGKELIKQQFLKNHNNF